MAKSLKDIIKKIAHSKGDERWIKAHSKGVTAKNDAPTSRDSQFHTDVPMFNRHIEHGYNPGEDEAKYDSYQKEVAESHSRNQLSQAISHHSKIADNLRSAAKKIRPGRLKAAGRELLGGRAARQRTKWERYDAAQADYEASKHERAADVAFELKRRKDNPGVNPQKWSEFKKSEKPVKPDWVSESLARDRLTRIMTALNEGKYEKGYKAGKKLGKKIAKYTTGDYPEVFSKGMSKSEYPYMIGLKQGFEFGQMKRGKKSPMSRPLKEGSIKDLDTKEKEEKRLGKKVLSDDERKKLAALKKRK